MKKPAPLLPASEAKAAAMLRDLGFPVKGHVVFHSEMHKGDDVHVAARKAMAAGAVSGWERFVPSGPKVMTDEGRALLAWFKAEGRHLDSPEAVRAHFGGAALAV